MDSCVGAMCCCSAGGWAPLRRTSTSVCVCAPAVIQKRGKVDGEKGDSQVSQNTHTHTARSIELRIGLCNSGCCCCLKEATHWYWLRCQRDHLLSIFPHTTDHTTNYRCDTVLSSNQILCRLHFDSS